MKTMRELMDEVRTEAAADARAGMFLADIYVTPEFRMTYGAAWRAEGARQLAAARDPAPSGITEP